MAINQAGYRTYAGRDPFPFYDEIRRQAPVFWDESTCAWLVTDYETCAYVLVNDSLFNRADKVLAGGRAIRGDTRNLAVTEGEEHARLHRYLMNLVDQKSTGVYRKSIIRPIAEQLIDRFVHRGEANLADEFTNQMPLRVGLTLIGVGAEDEALVEQIRLLKLETARWHETVGEVPEDTERAGRAAKQLKDLIMPVVRARKTEPRDDLISELWRSGASIFPDWGEEDTFAGCLAHLGGGETQFLLRNLVYLILTDHHLRDRLALEPATLIPRFVEETLRAVGVVHWQIRIASQDVELGGQHIKQGDRVFPMFAAANRDPAVYECPAELNLEGPKRKNHLAFGLGPRFCIGSSLARAEAQEAVEALLDRLPNLRLDESKEAPRYVNFHVRSFTPLYALWDTAES